jgi:serine/threonine protein kinase
MPCPDRELLQRFALGHLQPAEVETLAEHVESCAHCVAALHGLRGNDQLLSAMQGLPAEQTEPAIALMEQFCALRTPSFPATTGGFGVDRRGLLAQLGELSTESTLELYDFLSPPQDPNELGRLGHFRVLKVLGAGGMGVVFDAEDLALKRRVALKVLRPILATSASARRRFVREGQAAAALHHDLIVPIYHVGEDRGIPFLAMPLLQGETLEERLRREAPLPGVEVLRIGRQIALGLAAAHAVGLIHRDVKPSNIMLVNGGVVSGQCRTVSDDARDAHLFMQGITGGGACNESALSVDDTEPQRVTATTHHSPLTTHHSPFRVMLLDFGLARAVGGDAHLTQSGVVVGTPAYMAPEQARGDPVDQRSDLFSLGCVLYRSSTGKLPFPGRNALDTLLALAQHEPPSPAELNPDLPPGLSELIVKLLARQPEERYPTARGVVEALDAVAAGRGSQTARPRRRGRRTWASLAAAALLAVVALGVWSLRPTHLPWAHEPHDPATVDLFLPAVHHDAGLYPNAVAVADFNGDGKPDLVIGHLQSHSVGVLLGNGDGTFRPPLTATIGEWFVHSLTVADLNGDGKPDLVVVVDNHVAVLLGKGDGTFRPPVPCSAGTNPVRVTVADFDGDGKPDLAVANREGTVSILRGNGDGTFQAAVTSSVGKECKAVIVGDFDRDGKLDLAVLDAHARRIGVLRGKGDGSFHAVAYHGVGESAPPLALTVADVNGDGRLDLVVGTTNGATVLLGKGDGSFQEAVSFDVGQVCHTVVAVDLDGDGWPDIAMTYEGTARKPGRTVTLLLNNRDGTFGKPLTYEVGHSPNSLAVGDFNGDGAPDLAVANVGSNTISILMHQPPPADRAYLGPATDLAAGTEPRAVVVGDFDRDGKDDLVVADYGSQVIQFLRGKGDGTFAEGVRHPAGNGPIALAAADLDRDGRLDLAVVNALDNTVAVYLGKGDGTFAAPVPYEVGKKPMAVAVADVNGDGKPDLVVANYDDGSVSVLLGKDDGVFRQGRRFPSGKNPRSVAIADVNGDGRPDVIVANRFHSGTVSVLLGRGDGTFAAPLAFPVGSFPISVAVGDFNRDGKLDLAVANWGSSDVNVLLGKGDGTFRTPDNYGVHLANPFAIATADLDGDGKLDLVVAMGGDLNVVRLFRGKGDGTFGTEWRHYPTGLDPYGLALGHFRSRARPEVVTANAHSSDVSVLLHRPAGPYLSVESQSKSIDVDGMTCELGVAAHGADDPWDVPDKSFTGTILLRCTDPRAELPSEYTYVPQDGGGRNLSVTLRTAGSQKITISDAEGKLLPTSVTLRVHKKADIHFELETPATVEAGKPFDANVNILNRFNRWITGYGGTIRFHCTDPAAKLPADHTFDRTIVHTFQNAFILPTPGKWKITVTDTAFPRLTESVSVTVRPTKATGDR